MEFLCERWWRLETTFLVIKVFSWTFFFFFLDFLFCELLLNVLCVLLGKQGKLSSILSSPNPSFCDPQHAGTLQDRQFANLNISPQMLRGFLLSTFKSLKMTGDAMFWGKFIFLIMKIFMFSNFWFCVFYRKIPTLHCTHEYQVKWDLRQWTKSHEYTICGFGHCRNSCLARKTY